ncbi:hypothetical protein [Thioalkalivibrio sp. ALE19]|uniref:hypothetical protein n=1 Tax=Thioalkalivibrio sp. ALE19 TaxID=1266909 RepID=UPI0012DE83A9|nr:hypothetical protein [Thioalkalivibrio sp. ALE19]
MQKVFIPLILSLFYLAFLPGNASAEISARDYQSYKDDDAFRLMIHGMGLAYSWANIAIQHEGDSPLYCPPSDLRADANMHLSILNEEFDANSRVYLEDDIPIALVLLRGLKAAFPCD